jgi:hypothetical protein
MTTGNNYGAGSYAYGQKNNAMPLSISCQVQPIAATQPQNYLNTSYRDSETTQVQVTPQKDKDKSKESSSEENTDGSVTTAKPGDDSSISSTSNPDILPSNKQAIDQANQDKDKPRTQPGGQPTQPGGGARPQGGTAAVAPTGRANEWSRRDGSGWPGHQGPGWQIMHQTNAAPPMGYQRYPAPPFPQFGPEFY